MICTTNHINKCAGEFLDRFDIIKIPLPSRQERIDALRHFFIRNDMPKFAPGTIKQLYTSIVTKAPEAAKGKLQELDTLIATIESSFTKLVPFNLHKNAELKLIHPLLTRFKDIITLCEGLATQENAEHSLKNEIAVLKKLYDMWMLKYNTCLFVTSPHELFDAIIDQTEHTSLRFLKYLANDVLSVVKQTGCHFTKEIINSRIQAAEIRFNANTLQTKEIYKKWQDEILAIQRGVLVIQIASTAGSLVIQGLSHMDMINNGASSLY